MASNALRRLRSLAAHVAGAEPPSPAERLEQLLGQRAALDADIELLSRSVAQRRLGSRCAPGKPTSMEEYLFEKDGVITLKGALSPAEVQACNNCLDTIPWNPEADDALQSGDWWGSVQAHMYGGGGNWKDGVNLQQIYEAGAPFEALIDHPSWIDRVQHFLGGEGSFDNSWGPCFIDECFANFRGPGEAIGVHSGATPPIARNAYAYRSWGGDHAGSRFMSMQLNVLIALTDIGPGDGGTMLIPASHKASLPHPQIIGRTEALAKPGATADNVPGAAHTDEVTAAVEMFMEAGDALLFSDATAHGSAKRINDGVRRVVVYRYQPSWANFRIPYEASPELLGRLTPERAAIVAPRWANKMEKQPQRKPGVGHQGGDEGAREEPDGRDEVFREASDGLLLTSGDRMLDGDAAKRRPRDWV